jgi:hypothetical protein
MALSPSAITVADVPMRKANVITTLFQSVAVLIKHLVLVNEWPEKSQTRSIKPVFPLVVVVEAALIQLRTRIESAINNLKCGKTSLQCADLIH